MRTFRVLVFLSAIAIAVSASAATIGGVISDQHRRGVAVDARHVEGAWRPAKRRSSTPTPPAVTRFNVATHRHVPGDRQAQRFFRGGAHGRDRAARITPSICPVSLELGAMSDQVTVTVQPIRARGAADSAACRNHVARRDRTGAMSLSTGDALAGCRQRQRRRQRTVRRPAAPARPRFDAHARARRRRASEHRPAGDRSHRRRGRADLAGLDQPHRDHQRRRHADVRIGRAGRNRQHHHQRNVVLADEAAALRLQRLLQLERKRHARHRDARRIVAARHLPHPGRGGEVRQLQGRLVRRRRYAAALRERHAQAGRHDRHQLRLQLRRVPRSVQSRRSCGPTPRS